MTVNLGESSPIGRLLSRALLIIFGVGACGGGYSGPSVPSRLPPYNFVGVTTSAIGVDGVRATITWTVPPTTQLGSAQSTWIGIFGSADKTTGLSFETAQVGWKQQGSEPARVFWEWGLDQSHFTIRYGPVIGAGQHLQVELDRSSTGEYTFMAGGELLDWARLGWTPAFVGADAEAHDPEDRMPGSSAAPEIIAGLEEKIQDQWQPISGHARSTDRNYRVATDAGGNLLIWDTRVSSSGTSVRLYIVPSRKICGSRRIQLA